MREIVVGTSRFQLGEKIGGGGEGEVFVVTGRAGQAVKIYGAAIRAARESKVRAMVHGGLAAKTDLVAYPGEVATDVNGQFLGFLMRLVSGYRPLHELYSPKSRQHHFPKADYRFVVRAALNVARAVGKVHQTGCVIGDLNHSGVLVAQDATVALIDADSFQFNLNGKTYPCLVGVEDFTPPELHGINLGTVTRTLQHDNFGLAVAIFHLLFMGRHPYAGVYKGPDLSMGASIAQNRFAFSVLRRSETQTSPPPGALTLDLFPSSVSSAFERAFGLNTSSRPNAAEWVDVLTKLEGALSRCGKVKSHFYPVNAKGCAWCSRAARSGFDMFPDLSSVSPNILTDVSGTEEAIREILAFRFPTASEVLSLSVSVPPGPSAALRKAKNAKRGQALKALLMIAGAAAGLTFATPVWFLWFGLAGWGVTILHDRKVSKGAFLSRFEAADGRVQDELDAFMRRGNLTEVIQVRADLDGEIEAYKRIDEDLALELRNLKSTREARQRSAFLDQFQVRRASIPGIGPAKTATLISFGIETAADVNWSAVRAVPGFGDVMTQKLVNWRKTHDAMFRYNPAPNAQDITDERVLRSKYAGMKAKLEASIRSGLTTLRTAKPRLDALASCVRGESALIQALEERTRVEQDLRLLGVRVPSSTVRLRAAVRSRSVPPPAFRSTIASQVPAFGAVGGSPNCPTCGAPMHRRSGRYGQFWGCSRYPSCRGTRNT
ncbi:topoisomerase DNA-binding C4 zinc finger domain-containing protein [Rhodovulum kholense]|uniref:DNA-binding helix-hairpin-helix protein with protein kinase domain n=1 Tax=Rhodovulum kholense TaxID=453584 RepID=A0A8E2VHI1_9RHOB|nr:topoisomerase DNA-binding C4 zinc finger domain-containing protein [Rhodovulum kholense]PTW45711.1 DNA-binding helix-hairpin-helix protein with protein kinase domain [Rhodovulum kholense]